MDDDGSQDGAVDYDGEGREQAMRDGGDSGVAMMVAVKMAAAEDSGGRRQQRWLTASMRAAAADDGVDGIVFRKEWYRKTGKEVMEGRPLLHRLLGSILKDVEFVQN